MVDIANLKVGDKVYYQPPHYSEDKWDNGIVKEIPEETKAFVRVVFHCAGEWDNYKDYTSQLTSKFHLNLGWKY